MLTNAGRAYLVSVHMLFPVLYISNEFDEISWLPEYEEIAGFLIEEFGFPFEHEQLPDEEQISFHREGEEYGEAVVGYFDKKFQSIAKEIDKKYEIDREKTMYILFNLWVSKVLDIFDGLMQLPVIRESIYHDNYEQEKQEFADLKSAVDRAITLQRTTMSESAWAEFENISSELSVDWHNQVQSVIEDKKRGM